MLLWRRAVLLGLWSWLVPFAVSFLTFPIKQANAPLFGTLMSLVVLMPAAAYYSEIGLSYLALPAFAFGAARMARP